MKISPICFLMVQRQVMPVYKHTKNKHLGVTFGTTPASVSSLRRRRRV